jgi:hypothetical protein
MFVYISDYFADEILGGGELNDKELLLILMKRGYKIRKYKSNAVTEDIIEEHKDACFIVSNFVFLPQHIMTLLYEKKYIIYEHDHKYVATRNPALYKDFVCPKQLIVNYELYKNAKAVFCQSNLHKQIITKNLELNNVISIGGNLWSIEDLEYMKTILQKEKQNICSILESNINHKNTIGAIEYCNKNKISYTLIKSNNYYEFLNLLGSNKQFCFLPKTPETLSRVVVEARMMGVSVIANKLLGATSEQWFELSGIELINVMILKRDQIAQKIEDIF